MSQLDIAKETIAYLKFWLGVLVVSDISLVGWLLTNAGTKSDLKTGGAILRTIIITVAVLFVHKKIEHLISTLEDLKMDILSTIVLVVVVSVFAFIAYDAAHGK